jgi:UDP-N-acetyl-D-galactosamine dehydrogenase
MPTRPAASTGDKIAVIGLGYVGLPLAVFLARGGAGRITGYDIKPERIAELESGQDHTGEVDGPELQGLANLAFAHDPAALRGQDIYIITAPTPVDEANEPDLKPLLGACETVGGALAGRKRGQAEAPIVVFESTVYPGVTEDICGPEIARVSGGRVGEDFLLGYSPERINPGDRKHRIDQIVKVVAGATPAVTERLAAVYARVSKAGVHRAPSIRTAEAAKVIENAQRDINIAFINEVAMIFADLGLSTYDVLEAARTKWNFLDFRPGMVGGHCIGVDPFYLAHCARKLGHSAEVILAGRRTNDSMAADLARRIAAAAKGGAAHPRSLVLGLTFKENVPDLRNSKVADLVRGLEALGHKVEVRDPRADPAEAKAIYGIDLGQSEDGNFDCLVGAVAHREYCAFTESDFARLVKPGGLIADIKGIWRNSKLPPDRRRWQL